MKVFDVHSLDQSKDPLNPQDLQDPPDQKPLLFSSTLFLALVISLGVWISLDASSHQSIVLSKDLQFSLYKAVSINFLNTGFLAVKY